MMNLPVATSRLLRRAIQNVLNRKVNVVSAAQASNLDAIGETREGAVGPAASAVLRRVLVQRMGQVADAVHVSPREFLGEGGRRDVFVRKGRVMTVVDGIRADLESKRTTSEIMIL